jgi:hypothetical protein
MRMRVYERGTRAPQLPGLRVDSGHDPLLPLRGDGTGAPMRVTDRDRRMIIKLAAARWLTTTQIAELCFSGLSLEMARRRIRLLRDMRYLRSVRSNAMAEAIHALGPRGLELLGRTGSQRNRPERVLPRNLAHLMGINDIRVSVERAACAPGITLGFFFAAWELQAHGWKFPLIPDAACRIERGRTSVTALFEYDRGEERPSYLLRTKFARYRAGLSGFPFSRVIVVAETAELRDRLQAYCGNHFPSPLFSFVGRETITQPGGITEFLL